MTQESAEFEEFWANNHACNQHERCFLVENRMAGTKYGLHQNNGNLLLPLYDVTQRKFQEKLTKSKYHEGVIFNNKHNTCTFPENLETVVRRHNAQLVQEKRDQMKGNLLCNFYTEDNDDDLFLTSLQDDMSCCSINSRFRSLELTEYDTDSAFSSVKPIYEQHIQNDIYHNNHSHQDDYLVIIIDSEKQNQEGKSTIIQDKKLLNTASPNSTRQICSRVCKRLQCSDPIINDNDGDHGTNEITIIQNSRALTELKDWDIISLSH